ncbi:MAG: hypothetical protein Q4G68_11080 [Planctomycetia bacterium]|nr:hypothetical protein [Planctomycetia bacterium]
MFIATFAIASDGGTCESVPIGNQLELFVDSHILGTMDGVTRILHEPRDEGAVIVLNKSWEGPISAYFTVIKDGEESYKMYYRAGEYLTAVLTSRDGKTWERPQFDLVEKGGEKTNIIYKTTTGGVTHNFAPFIDTRPGVPQTERYKALGGLDALFAFVSEDGIHWKKIQDNGVIRENRKAFDSQNVAFWSESENKYICYYRTSVDKIRKIARVESDDFIHWTAPQEMTYGDVPFEQLYTNQTLPYYRAPQIYLAIAARFMKDKQVVSEEKAKELGVVMDMYHDCSDVILMTTRGGYVYDRTFMEGFVRPGIGWENWVSRSNYPARGIVQTSPTEMSLYVQHNFAQPTHEIHRYSLRIDGFVSVHASYQEGVFTTKPLTFSGSDLILNYSTSAAGSIEVELLDENDCPIPGFERAQSPLLVGNWIDDVVLFKNNKNVNELIGKPVKIRFYMKDADLYSLQFK